MRLPVRQEGPVQELVGVDPGVYAQRGQALGRFGQTVSDISAEWYERADARSEAQAVVDYSNAMTAFETEHGNKRTFTADEVASLGVDVPEAQRWDYWIDSEQNERKTAKEEYNAEDVYPAALKKRMEAQARASSRGILSSGRRTRFVEHEQELINKRYLQAEAQAVAQREAKILTQYELNIQNAEIAGNYPVSVRLVEDHPILSREEKDAEILRLIKADESRHLFHVRQDGSDGDINREIARLSSNEYGQDKDGDWRNSLSQRERERELGNLRHELKAREADRKDRINTNFAAFHNDFYNFVDEPESSRSDGLAVIDRGLQAGILKQADVTRMRNYINDVKGGGGVERRATAEKQRATAEKQRATAEKQQRVIEAQQQFIDMDDLPIDVLQGMNYNGELDKLAGVITPAQLKHLKAKSRAGLENQQSSWKENIDYAESQLGFVLPKGANDKEKRQYAQEKAAVRRLLYGQFRQFERDQGRAPDSNERQEITDRLLISQTRQKRLVMFGGDQRYKTKNVELADIPYQRWDTITRVLTMAGEAPGEMTSTDYHAVNTIIDEIEKAGVDNPTPKQIDEVRMIIENDRAPGTAIRQWAYDQQRRAVVE